MGLPVPRQSFSMYLTSLHLWSAKTCKLNHFSFRNFLFFFSFQKHVLISGLHNRLYSTLINCIFWGRKDWSEWAFVGLVGNLLFMIRGLQIKKKSAKTFGDQSHLSMFFLSWHPLNIFSREYPLESRYIFWENSRGYRSGP